MRTRLIAMAVAAAALAAASGGAQGPPPAGVQPPQAPAQATPPPQPDQRPASDIPPVTFRVEIDYVEVDATVTDRQGRIVGDLRREDFELFEDGVPQKIELFSFVDIPIARPEQPLFADRPIEPDVRTNTRFEGRLYVIVLDDLHTHALRSSLVKRAARQFIERYLGANDLAAVVHVSGRADASQDFTTSKRLLLAAVDRFMGRKLRSATLGRLDEYNRQRDLPQQQDSSRPDRRIDDPDEAERGYNARTAMDTLKGLADFMNGIRGRRKAIVYFGEGIDYDIYDVINNRSASTVLDSTRDAIAAATRANVSIYAIDPRGLTSLGDEAIELTNLPEDPGLGIGPTAFQNELRLSQDSLRVLADETGGFAAVNANDFSTAFERVVRENSAYYVLGYYPTNTRRDGKFRKIEVRVRRPDLEVRARKGYVAPRGRQDRPASETAPGTSAALREALNSPLPEAGLPLAVTAAPFKGPAPKASVLVTIQVDGRRFRFAEKDGQFVDSLEVSLMAIDSRGKVQGGDRQTIDLKLRPQTRQAVEAAGFRTLSRLELEPGRYQLRVGARAAAAGAIGSVFYDLEVPDFSKTPFSMSGLVVSAASAGLTPTARADEPLRQVLKTPPTVARDFSAADTLLVYAEVYDNQAGTPHEVEVTTTLTAEDGRTVFKTAEQRSSDEIQGARGGYGVTAQIPLAEVAPGLYVLRVEARSRLSGTAPVARETLVRVWPRPGQPTAPPPQDLAKILVPVARGPMSGVDVYREAVARTPAEFEALWSGLPMRRPAPRVNFDSTMIVGLFLGTRPTAGYSVEFVGLKRDGETLVVEYVEHQPDEGTANSQILTTPYAIAGVPMYAGPVRFDRVERRP
jgi:VWFA-related protein